MSKYNTAMNPDPSGIPGKIMAEIAPGSDVLEFGCAGGHMTRYMAEELNCRVSIAEINESDYATASAFAQDGFCGDIESLRWCDTFEGREYDCILFADVLEHLRDPETVLRRAGDFLREGGKVLVSLPNIAHHDVLVNLYNNRFRYTSLGLLDETHIHFWGRQDLGDLAKNCGYGIRILDGVNAPPFSTEQTPDRHIPPELESALLLREGNALYQFFLVLQKTEWMEKRSLATEVRLPCDIAGAAGFFFWDTGSGYRLDNALQLFPERLPGGFRRFTCDCIPENCRTIRFDPCDYPAKIRLSATDETGSSLPMLPSNRSSEENGADCFMHGDPFYELDLSGQASPKRIEIHALLSPVSASEVENYWTERTRKLSADIDNLNSHYSRQMATLSSQLDLKTAEHREESEKAEALSRELGTVRSELDSTSVRLVDVTNELCRTGAQLNAVTDTLHQTEGQLDAVTDELHRTDSRLNMSTAELQHIYGQLSNAWTQLQARTEQFRALSVSNHQLSQQLSALQTEHNAVLSTRSWRITKPLRTLLTLYKGAKAYAAAFAALVRKAFALWKNEGFRALLTALRRYGHKSVCRETAAAEIQVPRAGQPPADRLTCCFRDNLPEPADVPGAWIELQPQKPLISIVMAVRCVAERGSQITRALESVAVQKYRNLELLLVCPFSEQAQTETLLLPFRNRIPTRLLLAEDSGIQRDFWDVALKEATGRFAAVMEQEDVLTPNLLAYILDGINERPETELFVVPDDRFFEDGDYFQPDRKIGLKWGIGGTESLLHPGFFRNHGLLFARGELESWALRLKEEQIQVLPWIGCHGEALESVWQDTPSVRCLAFYLPQFHTIPENDLWWGKGFTEWVNVKKAFPLYPGHNQPRIPGELGYYDLGDEESGGNIQKKQIELAKEYGLSGFCYYYYWFTGRKRLLEKPLDRFVKDKSMDFPFCLCWANENWSRRWDGSENEVLMPQTYEEGWAEEFILDLLPYLRDERYIRVNGAPYIMIYHVADIPNAGAAISTWRRIASEHGIERLHISAVRRTLDAREFEQSGYTLDSLTDFPPHLINQIDIRHNASDLLVNSSEQIKDYHKTVLFHANMEKQNYTYFRTAMLEWDNTARKGANATVFDNFTQRDYLKWLYAAKRYTLRQNRSGEDLMFINAWNEWAEGTYLEPSEPNGRLALETTGKALRMR